MAVKELKGEDVVHKAYASVKVRSVPILRHVFFSSHTPWEWLYNLGMAVGLLSVFLTKHLIRYS